MEYDAVLFDNDGVLTTPTSRRALDRAMETAFNAVGVRTQTSDHAETLINPDISSLETIAAEYDVTAEELWNARERAAIDVQLEEIRAGRKTLYDDITSLESLEHRCAIVSNNQHETITNIVEYFELDWFDPCYGREPTVEGIRRKKPTPYYLEQAISEIEAKKPVYVGDSWVDVAAAEALEIDSVFIRRAHRAEYELTVEPTHEIESLWDLSKII